MKNEYYKVCLRHMFQKENSFLFWGPNNSGYTKAINNAGLYPKDGNTSFETQVNRGDFLIHKDIIEKNKELIRLPKYGDVEEEYGGLNEFFVLPSTGQVRKSLGIIVTDIPNEGRTNDSFNADFRDSYIEKFKWVYSDNLYRVKGKSSEFDEYWYYDETFEAENRNQAIVKAYKEWDCNYEMSYIEFKSKVTCSKNREKVFDKWVKY